LVVEDDDEDGAGDAAGFASVLDGAGLLSPDDSVFDPDDAAGLAPPLPA